jgi:CubicO group peptidase (beta-lactamase class C family)
MLTRRTALLATGAFALLPGASRARPSARGNPEVEALAAQAGFNGVIATGRNGRVDYIRAFGAADLEAHVPLRADSLFCIASISKWLTAAAVLRLVDRNRLSLDAPITEWLPAYRADTGARLNLRRLLSNTSGVPTAPFGAAVNEDRSLLTRPVPIDEAIRRFCQGDLAFEPGTRFDYAFTNWIIILAIIEAVTGRPYPAAMRNLVLDQLGLRRTDVTDALAGSRATAVSYRTLSPILRQTNDRLPMMAAAAGFYSDAAGLVRAAHGIFDRNFLSAGSQRTLRNVVVPTEDYALGGRIRSLQIGGRAVETAWNTGSSAGYRSLMVHRFDTHTTAIVLNNASMAGDVRARLAERLIGASSGA